MRWRHQWGYKLLDTSTRKTWTEKIDGGARLVQGGEKREAEQVISMTVGNEEREVERFAPRTSQKLIAQANDAAPRVQDQRMLPYLDFDTGGICSIVHRLLILRWQRY